MINKEVIRAYALKNAVEHGGKAIIGSVINSLFNEGLKKDKIKEIIPEVNEILKEVNSIDLEEQMQRLAERENLIGHRKERCGLPELPNAKKGKVIMRFPPSPSAPLHIGHILTIGPNFLYVKKYNGKFYVRIEDTDPDTVYKPAYNLIKEDIKWLCGKNVKMIIQSDRMKTYYSYAEKLIKKNAAYICTCDKDKFKQMLLAKKPCPCRNLSKKENLDRWKKMLSKAKDSYKEGEAVLRFKSDLENPNPAFRDFPLARINSSRHPRQGSRYRVWPLMNLAVTADDIEEKMTHIIRGKDHRDNAERQKMIYNALGKGKLYPWTAFIGRLHFKGLELSKRKMRQGIESGEYKGWDDPELPTAISLRKQGYKPETFWKFVEQRGISEADKVISRKDFFQVLDNFQKEFLKESRKNKKEPDH